MRANGETGGAGGSFQPTGEKGVGEEDGAICKGGGKKTTKRGKGDSKGRAQLGQTQEGRCQVWVWICLIVCGRVSCLQVVRTAGAAQQGGFQKSRVRFADEVLRMCVHVFGLRVRVRALTPQGFPTTTCFKDLKTLDPHIDKTPSKYTVRSIFSAPSKDS